MASVGVEGLRKAFGAVRAVDEVSFTVPGGSVLTMLGPSGCGKTTILRCIAGLETADGGRIVIGDDTVFADGRVMVAAEQRNLGMVFQSYAIWPHMTVFENVAFGLRVRRKAAREVADAVREALTLVRLTGFEGRYPGQLSGGQMQRVVLARCLAYRPQLLLLDEPLANLDTNLREEMRAELRRIQRETRTTMIAVTHDQAEALALSDQILVMGEGRVLQRGTPQEIFGRPDSGTVAAFLGASNSFVAERGADGSLMVAGVGKLNGFAAPAGAARCRVFVRPDDIVLRSSGASDDGWQGRIETAQYLGRDTQYIVACGALRLVVEERGTDAPLPEGAAVAVTISPGRARLYAEGAA